MMTIGAFGLVLGPWFKSNYFSVPGLVLHLSATIWLLMNIIKPLLGDRNAWSQPGIWHLVAAYFWILAPVLVAPLIILGVPGALTETVRVAPCRLPRKQAIVELLFKLVNLHPQ
jgi:hypothetical protein